MTLFVNNCDMNITVKIKLLPSNEQKRSLLSTMTLFNNAASFAAMAGFEGHVFSQPSIHKLAYYAIREKYGLSAQLAVRAIGKAVECFKRDKTKCPTFNPRSAVIYDERIMRFIGLESVNLGTTGGRITIPIIVSGYQSDKLQAAIKTGQADLVYVNRAFYLLLSVQFEDSPKLSTSGVLGIDLGVNEIAVDSEGNAYTGKDVEAYRVKTQTIRSALQSKGTRSAKRHLRKIRRKESNYRRTKNHQISRRIVDTAKARNLSIAIENLKGISKTTRLVRKSQRSRMTGWAYAQLGSFICYKSELAGIPVEIVDPRNTSRTCSKCGHCDKKNRKSQSKFLCVICGHAENADLNAAKNIRSKGSISKPIVTNDDSRLEPVTS